MNQNLSVEGNLTVSGINGITTSNIVQGPTVSADNALARYDGTTGKLIQNSNATLDDDGNLTVLGDTTLAGNLYAMGNTSFAIGVTGIVSTWIEGNTSSLKLSVDGTYEGYLEIFQSRIDASKVLQYITGVQTSFTGREIPDANWITASQEGFVTGQTSQDNAIVRWDGISGKLIQNSTAILTDGGTLLLTEGFACTGSSSAFTSYNSTTSFTTTSGVISLSSASSINLTSNLHLSISSPYLDVVTASYISLTAIGPFYLKSNGGITMTTSGPITLDAGPGNHYVSGALMSLTATGNYTLDCAQIITLDASQGFYFKDDGTQIANFVNGNISFDVSNSHYVFQNGYIKSEISTGNYITQQGTNIYISATDGCRLHLSDGNVTYLGYDTSRYFSMSETYAYLSYRTLVSGILNAAGGVTNYSTMLGTGASANFHSVEQSETNSTRGYLAAQHSSGTSGAKFVGRKSRGTVSTPTGVTVGDALVRLSGGGFDGTNWVDNEVGYSGKLVELLVQV